MHILRLYMKGEYFKPLNGRIGRKEYIFADAAERTMDGRTTAFNHPKLPSFLYFIYNKE